MLQKGKELFRIYFVEKGLILNTLKRLEEHDEEGTEQWFSVEMLWPFMVTF